MTEDTLRYWMWGYQEYFRKGLARIAKTVLEDIAAPCEPEALLVGVRSPGSSRADPICVDPQVGPVPIETFTDMAAHIEAAIPLHPLQTMSYGDDARMRDKPENIRALVITDHVKERLVALDARQGMTSFVGYPRQIGDYHVAIVLRVPTAVVQRHPDLQLVNLRDEPFSYGFLRACIEHLLSTASQRLQGRDPGRWMGDDLLKPDEIIRRAAISFLQIISAQICEHRAGVDLFERLNGIAALRYEGDEGVGRLILVEPEKDQPDYLLQLDEPVRLEEARWGRKILEMAADDTSIIATISQILGVGKVPSPAGRLNLSVDFHGHHDWELRNGEDLLLRTHFGKPQLPHEVLTSERFTDNVSRLFPHSTPEDIEWLWELMKFQSRRAGGSLLIVAEDAAAEAERLRHQATRITPKRMTPEALEHACRIDGGVLVDPAGICFAIGVVLDGPAREECTPSRGARFNSAVRYVLNGEPARMAIVVSDDRTVDVVPLLLPRIERARLEANIAELERATRRNFHTSRLFLDNHRFYLDATQCDRINEAIGKIEASPHIGNLIYFSIAPFVPDDRLTTDYLI